MQTKNFKNDNINLIICRVEDNCESCTAQGVDELTK